MNDPDAKAWKDDCCCLFRWLAVANWMVASYLESSQRVWIRSAVQGMREGGEPQISRDEREESRKQRPAESCAAAHTQFRQVYRITCIQITTRAASFSGMSSSQVLEMADRLRVSDTPDDILQA